MREKKECRFCKKPMGAQNRCRRAECAERELTRDRESYAMTFAEIGEKMNLSHERVRQIYESAMIKLRKAMIRKLDNELKYW